jgi:hypothetical protein
VAVVLAGIAWSLTAASATIESVDVRREHKRYHLRAETYLDASADSIYGILIDYGDDHFARISSIYKESSYLPAADEEGPLVYTLVEECLLFFCRSMRRVEKLETTQPFFIRTTTLPDRSDFTHSISEWVLEPDSRGTKVVYRLEMEPKFSLPPFVGPWFLKRFLARGGIDAVERIEDLARNSTLKLRRTSRRLLR